MTMVGGSTQLEALLWGPCLFCKTTEGPFSAAEHVFPESLGNKVYILPKGVVCDPCNHGVLAGLDAELLGFDPVMMLRATLGIRTKAGKLPEAKFPNLRVRRREDGVVTIHAPGRHKVARLRPDGLEMTPRGTKKLTVDRCRRLARAFYKIGLELLYLQRGQAFVLGAQFDELREIVRGRVPFHGYLLVAFGGDIRSQVGARWEEMTGHGHVTTFFDVDICSFRVMFDLEWHHLLPPMREEAERQGWSVLEF